MFFQTHSGTCTPTTAFTPAMRHPVFNLVLPFAGRFCAGIFSLAVFGGGEVAAQTPGTGSIRGTVVNEATRTFVEGATVTLDGTPPRTAVTDSQGAFFIGAVPAGAHRLRVESSGASAADVAVSVEGGATKTVPVQLASEIVRLQPVMVTAQVEGQAQSLNLQKNAENVR